jgi:hypothetical protein
LIIDAQRCEFLQAKGDHLRKREVCNIGQEPRRLFLSFNPGQDSILPEGNESHRGQQERWQDDQRALPDEARGGARRN